MRTISAKLYTSSLSLILDVNEKIGQLMFHFHCRYIAFLYITDLIISSLTNSWVNEVFKYLKKETRAEN